MAFTAKTLTKAQVAAKAKRDQFFARECGRVKIRQYHHGWKLFLIDMERPYYFTSFDSIINSRKVAEFERFNATEDEKTFLDNLRQGGK